jgi:hypothetical protein
MDKSSGLKPLSRLTGTAQRYWAAAAAVLALVGFFVFFNSNDIEQPQLANAVSQQPVSETLASEQSASQQPESESPKKSGGQVRDSGIAMNQATCPPDFADEPEQVPSAEEKDEPIENVQTEHEELRAEKTAAHTNLEHKGMQGHHKWSLDVNASGGLLAANTSQRVDRLYYLSANNLGEAGYWGPGAQGATGAPDEKSDKENNGIQSNYNSYTLTEYRSEHHLPIRFGVSLNYQLTPHIALHSGISYTYLYSEFSIPLYEQASYNQKLHYLGIPLGVSWQLWKTSHFQFYVFGGMMLEKCVSAEAEGGSTIKKKPWQWSVNAAAGAEYKLFSQLGFYLEPSLGYYFDDGTSLEHYYKKHPLTPTIEFGLRLHLNK